MRILLAAALLFAVPGGAAAKEPAVSPEGMRGLGSADRVIVVGAAGMNTTHATARTYEKRDGRWRIVRKAMPARLGRSGLSRPTRRHSGDGTTPMGNYGFVYGFGSKPDPGVTGFSWRKLVAGACWAGTRENYNRWVNRTPCSPADENIWSHRGLAYRYAAVIDFNYENPVYGRGSGIFLHVQTGGPTAGCVSLRESDLLAVLRWMRPGTRILIGPTSWLKSLKRKAAAAQETLPSDTVARVGDRPLLRTVFDHWAEIASGHRDQAMSFLLSSFWIEGEAKERGIRVGRRTVSRVFNRQKRANFKTERAYRKHLRDTHQTADDLRYRVRIDLLSTRVLPHVSIPRFERKWRRRTVCAQGFGSRECGRVVPAGS